MFMTPFASHIWCLDHLDGLTHLSCIIRLTKMSKMTNTFYILLMYIGDYTQYAPEMEVSDSSQRHVRQTRGA